MPYKSKEDQAAAARRHYLKNKKAMMARAKAYDAKVVAEVRAVVVAAKDVPCTDCGRRFPSCAMDFDHVRGKKKFNIGAFRGHGYSVETVKAEIAKCEVVCACCHRIRTFGLDSL